MMTTFGNWSDPKYAKLFSMLHQPCHSNVCILVGYTAAVIVVTAIAAAVSVVAAACFSGSFVFSSLSFSIIQLLFVHIYIVLASTSRPLFAESWYSWVFHKNTRKTRTLFETTRLFFVVHTNIIFILCYFSAYFLSRISQTNTSFAHTYYSLFFPFPFRFWWHCAQTLKIREKLFTARWRMDLEKQEINLHKEYKCNTKRN